MAVKKVAASLDAVAKTVETKVEAPKTEAKPVEKKVEAPKAAAKPAAKKAEAPKAAAKPAAKKAEAPKATAKPVAKKAPAKATKVVAEVKIQVEDREYTQEDLVKIANDVWVYDYDKKSSELKKVQLYVKENVVYYVFNDDITGSFGI